MTRAVLTLVEAGPHTSVQDGGRRRLMRYGVPASGPMDRLAFAAGNAALGNEAGTPQIETSLGGLALECVEGVVTFALMGGGFRAMLDGTALPPWTVATLRIGSRLRVRPGFWGNWTYLAFAGQLQAAPWLGSVSTHGPSGLGGGRLQAGARIVIEAARCLPMREGSLPCPVPARPRDAVRVVLGPQDRFFPAETIATLLEQPFSLTSAYDRMGVRLKGPALRSAATLDMPSEALLRGSVQVAGDGVATVLLADHQTTGGYPKIATLISADLDAFVQIRPGARFAFRQVSPEAAVRAARARHHVLSAYLAELRAGKGRLVPT